MKTVISAMAVAGLMAAGPALAEKTGEEVFGAYCVACHGSGAPGIPQVGDKEAWAPRVALGADALVASVMNGKNAMPPMGLCGECSEAEIRNAVEHILSNSQ